MNYIFTNDAYYLQHRTKLIPTQRKDPAQKDKKGNRKEDDKAALVNAGGDKKENREELKKEAEKMFVKELR